MQKRGHLVRQQALEFQEISNKDKKQFGILRERDCTSVDVYHLSTAEFSYHVKRKTKIDNYGKITHSGNSNTSLYKLALTKSIAPSQNIRQKRCILRQKSVPSQIGSSRHRNSQKRNSQKRKLLVDSASTSVQSPAVSFVNCADFETSTSDSMWITTSPRRRIDLTKKQPRTKYSYKTHSWINYFIFPLFVVAMILIGALLYLFNNS